MAGSKKLTVGIIDLEVSNITSVSNAFERIGYSLHLINEAPHGSIVFSENKNAYCVSTENDVIDESPYPSIDIF